MQLLGLSDGGGIQALPQCHKSSLIWSVEAQTSCSRGLALGRVTPAKCSRDAALAEAGTGFLRCLQDQSKIITKEL